MATSRGSRPRHCSTICVPFDQDSYDATVTDPTRFRAALDDLFQDMPELFPEVFAHGYRLKEVRTSTRLGIRVRRIRCNRTGESFTIRPSFVMPYMVGLTEDVRDPLFLRSFGVPYWALAEVFGKSPMYWYRLEVAFGRNSVVGTTLRRASLPSHLVADEHHRSRDGVKNYIATTVGGGCCLGASLAETAGEEDLTKAYGVFKEEARGVEPKYSPETVNTDGWAATKAAWRTLFPMIVVVRCFLHGWLAIRSRGKLKDGFRELSKKVWEAYHSSDRRTFGQRLRRLREWTRRNITAAWVREKVEKLCDRVGQYGRAYQHPGCHRTSNMLDRVMRSMNRYFDRGQHLHGSLKAGELHVRAWALLSNFKLQSPSTRKKNGGRASPAERLNEHTYHPDWLQNLLVSASLGGYRR